MPGETKPDASGWTVETLYAHFERIIEEKQTQNNQRFEAQEKAVVKAETAAEKRFDAVNEFRAQLSDQARHFYPRTEAEGVMRAMTEEYKQLAKTNAGNIDNLERRMDRNDGRTTGLSQGWTLLIGAVGLIGIIYGVVAPKIERNSARLEAQQQAVPVPVTAPAPLPVKPVKETP